MDELQQKWNTCLQIIKDNLTASAFNTWFKGIEPVQFINHTLLLQMPSQFYINYIEENYIDLLGKTLYRVFGEDTTLEYRVLIDKQSGIGTQFPSEGAVADILRPAKPVQESKHQLQSAPVAQLDPQLNSHYTLQNFIEGSCNRLARQAAMAIAKDPGKTIFNPLFIYGGSGVGKTHLANAIGNAIHQLHPEKRVLYVAANTFQVQFQDAVISNKQNDFINFYQSIDVLIVDDIQYWAEKKGTQNTFFFIFNHMHQMGKQLILTSDKAPVDLKGMEERLLTRLKWGLSVEISKPDLELRHSILQERIHHDGLDIPEDIIDYIAENVKDNIRDLEGVLASLLAYSTLVNAPVNLELAEQVVSRIVNVIPHEIVMDDVLNAVSTYFNISRRELLSKCRTHDVAQARQIAMYLGKKHTGRPYSEIGKALGGKNHATVLYACTQIHDCMSYDRILRQQVSEIENQLV